MIHIDCPWCEAPVQLESLESLIRCDRCSIEVELVADEVLREVARAA